MSAAERATTLPASWLLALAMLSAAPVLRIGDVQLLEIVQALSVCAAAAWVAYGGFRIRFPEPWREYGVRYLVLLGLCAGVSALSLRLQFFPPPGISILKQPAAVSVSRLLELSLAMYSALAAAAAFRRNPKLLRMALDLYCGVAAVSAFLSILSWVLLEGGGIYTPMVYGFDDRVRGFFNEGGPYGMYLASAAVAALFRRRLFPPAYRGVIAWFLALDGAALLLSGSKAGLIAAAMLCGSGVLLAGSRKQKMALLAVAALALAATAGLFGSKFLNYWLLYQNFDEAAAYHPDDPNYVMGRVAGALIVPRMTAAHPAGGVGLGNYSLTRNDPEYLQGLPPTDEWDLTGMGLAGAAAELGVPLAVYLFWLLLRPVRRARAVRAPVAVGLAAAFQPVAFLLGVNLNFFYPWLVTAFALSWEPGR